jgi:hypothetical protein
VACPLSAITGREQVQHRQAYSITSSARASSVGGISKTNAFAVFEVDDELKLWSAAGPATLTV